MKQIITLIISLLAFTFAATAQNNMTFDPGRPWQKNPQSITNFTTPVKKWIPPTVKALSFAGAFAGGVCSGKGEWELAAKGWPRSQTSHLWRDAGNWTTGGSCMLMGIGVSLDGKVNWKEILWNGLGMAASNWLGTRVGYYKLRAQ